MSYMVEDHISTHPTNPVRVTGLTKAWAKQYPLTSRLKVHTSIDAQSGRVRAHFDEALLPPYDGDLLWMNEPSYPPTYRTWTLSYEEDVINWHHTEVSNAVLGAFARSSLILQSSHEKPLREHQIAETVDVAYSIKHGGRKCHIAIGEMKRNLINGRDWKGRKLRGSGVKIHKESGKSNYRQTRVRAPKPGRSQAVKHVASPFRTPVVR